METRLKFIIPILGLFCLFQCQKTVDISNQIAFRGKPKIDADTLKSLDSVDVDFQLRGDCFAFSSEKYAIESNGEAHWGNVAKPNGNKFEKGLFGLFVSENELQKIYEKNIGHSLYLINTTDKDMEFEAQDSRLDIITEVKSKGGVWTEITYLTSSWCGNSYHTINLGSGQYWEFVQPVYKGSFETTLRYKLELEDRTIVSNEIVAFVNPQQLDKSRKEGHDPSSIMDPYDY